MIAKLNPNDRSVALRIVEIQRAAYAVEADLIGFDEIPTLHETPAQIEQLTNLCWRGITVGTRLVAIIAWHTEPHLIDIDRLAVDPTAARRGYGRELVRAVPTDKRTIVSTGAKNVPARNLYLAEGFRPIGDTEISPDVFTTQFERTPR